MLGPAIMKKVFKKEQKPSVTEGKKGRRRRSASSGNGQRRRESTALGLKAISNCPACQGAVFKYSGKGRGYGSWEEKNLSQCLFCGRIYILSDKGYRQWPPRPKKSNKGKLTEDFRLSCE